MNKVHLIGRLTKDLELRTTQSGNNCISFSIAVDNGKDKDGNKREADFINCVAWEKSAEILHKYLKKGDLIYLGGCIKTYKYQNESGENRYKTYVLVQSFEFIQSRPKEEHLPEEPDYLKDKTQSQILADVMQNDAQPTNDPFKEFSNEIMLSPSDLPF